mmetsp:Transcript_45219/g.88785  ORF Transcript_45219/g.88785 Transcript_45219/m.88785 type:complete len:489 (+) Transcript_45219:870-2336(+)
MDRVVQLLSAKEKDILELRDQVAAIAPLNKQLKEKDATIKKLSKEAEKGRASKMLETRIRTLTEQLGAEQAKHRETAEAVEEQKEMLYLEEKAHADTRNMLSDHEELLEKERKQVVLVGLQLESLKQDSEQQLQEVREASQQFKQEMEDKFVTAQGEWAEQAKQNEIQMRETNESLKQVTDNLEAKVVEVQQLQARAAALSASEEKMSAEAQELGRQLAEMQNAATEFKLEQKIESKKRNRLVSELKKQLQKDTVKVRDLEAALAEKTDELANAEAAIKRSMDSVLQQTLSTAGPASPPSASSSSSSSAAVPTEVEEEVAAALSQRLEALQNANFDLTTKCYYLEQNIRLVNEDLLHKKAVVRNLFRRIETGALTAAADDGQAQQLYLSLSHSMRDELFNKMEITLQETTLQNSEFKDNLKKMGSEVGRLMALVTDAEASKNSLQDELDSVREMYEELKDEREVNDMALRDAQNLLKTYEQTAASKAP